MVGKTAADLIREELAARQAQAEAVPPPPPEGVPPPPPEAPPEGPSAPEPPEAPPGAPPAAVATPEPVPPTPAAPAAEVLPRPPAEPLSQGIRSAFDLEPTDAEVAADLAKQQRKAEKINASRSKAADNIAGFMRENGITMADVDAMDPAAADAFWRNAGATHRKGYSPSPDTIQYIRDRLEAAPAAGPAIQPGMSPAELGAELQRTVQPETAKAKPPAITAAGIARFLSSQGMDHATASKLTPQQWENAGVAPNQVGPVLDAMKKLAKDPELRQLAAQSRGASTSP